MSGRSHLGSAIVLAYDGKYSAYGRAEIIAAYGAQY